MVFFQDRVYSSFGMAVAISASVMPLYLTEEKEDGVAENGQNDGQESRTSDLEKKGLPMEQRIELVQTELANALTTVQKDNLVLEKEEYMAKKYRIRKLTEKECWRLMGYKDADYNKVAEVISACQRYKTAGNAIVKQVLMAIFLQMGIQGKKRWNSMDAEEKRSLVNGSLDFLK